MTTHFPVRMLAEAARNPGGWVYEIDGKFDPDGYVPMNAIIRAWKISPAGTPTGEMWNNPEYIRRFPGRNTVYRENSQR
jgi:hypothetical protein